MSVFSLIRWLIKNCYFHTHVIIMQSIWFFVPICKPRKLKCKTNFYSAQDVSKTLSTYLFLDLWKIRWTQQWFLSPMGLINFSHCTEKFWWSISICKDTHKRMKSSSLRKNPWSYLWKNLSLTCLLWNLLVCLWIWYRSNKKSY